ncbi:MAG: NlpC/P60 family protein, partial [Corynebacterium sp.]|nr:NlpC/P60 family protein [Corynebacterium sp.]
QPGDIVGYYPGVTHVGMYIGNGQVVHASTYGVPVQVVPLKSMPITGTARY